jgi:hypothetical protein
MSAVGGGEWTAFTPEERIPGTHWIGGWVGRRVCGDTSEKRKSLMPLWGDEHQFIGCAICRLVPGW